MSASVLDQVRPELRGFSGYGSARRSGISGSIWLNANESAKANPADLSAGSQRYPAPQPEPLRHALARLYQTRADRLLIGRGSDEAIDLLVRALCRPESVPCSCLLTMVSLSVVSDPRKQWILISAL